MEFAAIDCLGVHGTNGNGKPVPFSSFRIRSKDMTEKYALSGADRKKARMQELNRETAKILWSDMQRFFARGSAIFVDEELDLVETAAELSLDNKAALENWLRQGRVAPVNDKQAKLWLERDVVVWAVVMAPWVLVQPVK